MDRFLRRAETAFAVGVIFLALALGGAQKAAHAALLAAALTALLALKLTHTSAPDIRGFLRGAVLPVTAAIFLIGWSLFTAWIWDTRAPEAVRALWHPLWRDLQEGRGAVSLSPYRTLEGLAAFLAPAAAFVLGAFSARSRDERDWLARVFVAGALAFIVYALILWATGRGLTSGRLSAAFDTPNGAATALGVLVLFLGALVARAARRRLEGKEAMAAPRRARWVFALTAAPFAATAFVFGCAALLLTGSRAGFVALAAAAPLLVVLLLQAGRGGRFGVARILAALVPLGLAGLIFQAGGARVLDRIGGLGDAMQLRSAIWTTHWQAFLDRPWVGHGLNTFHELNLHYATPATRPALAEMGAAHNIYLSAAEETGLLGLFLFTLMLAPPLWRCLTHAWRRARGAEWAAATLAATLFVLAHGMVDFGLQIPALAALLAFFLGASGVAQIGAKQAAPAQIHASRLAESAK